MYEVYRADTGDVVSHHEHPEDAVRHARHRHLRDPLGNPYGARNAATGIVLSVNQLEKRKRGGDAFSEACRINNLLKEMGVTFA